MYYSQHFDDNAMKLKTIIIMLVAENKDFNERKTDSKRREEVF